MVASPPLRLARHAIKDERCEKKMKTVKMDRSASSDARTRPMALMMRSMRVTYVCHDIKYTYDRMMTHVRKRNPRVGHGRCVLFP